MSFKLAILAPAIAQNRLASAQSEAKMALAHAKTVTMCSTAFANQAKSRRKRQERLNAPVVVQAHRTAYDALRQAEELEDAVRRGVR